MGRGAQKAWFLTEQLLAADSCWGKEKSLFGCVITSRLSVVKWLSLHPLHICAALIVYTGLWKRKKFGREPERVRESWREDTGMDIIIFHCIYTINSSTIRFFIKENSHNILFQSHTICTLTYHFILFVIITNFKYFHQFLLWNVLVVKWTPSLTIPSK